MGREPPAWQQQEPAASLARRGRRLLHAVPLALLTLLAAGPALAAAITGHFTGAQEKGYGRLTLAFDDIVQARTRFSNGILVIDFDRPVAASVAKLPAEMAPYVSVARLDPDGKALRIALKAPYRINLLEAGETLFVDLLPSDWSGLPPGLPPRIVEALAVRALAAEEQLRKVRAERLLRKPKELSVRVIRAPGFTRLLFPVKPGVTADFVREGETGTLTLDGAFRFDARILKPDLPPVVKAVDSQLKDGEMVFTITAPADTALRGFREDDGYMIDIVPPRVKAAPGKGPLEAKLSPPPKLAAAEPPAAEKPAHEAAAKPAATPIPEQPKPVAAPAPVTAAPSATAPAPQTMAGPVVPRVEKAGDSIRIAFPFALPVPAAAFERGGTAWLVFEDRQAIGPLQLPDFAADSLDGARVERRAGAWVVRLKLRQPALLTMAPVGNGWVATIGDNLLSSTGALQLQPAFDKAGRTVLEAKLPGAGAVFWLDDPDAGDRLAVATAVAPARGLPKRQRYVEAEALQSAQGLVVRPLADDVMVKAGLDDVVISRERGLTVSPPAKAAKPETAATAPSLDIDPAVWNEDTTGNIRLREEKLQQQAADAPKRDRSAARLRLAQFLIANGFYPEAATVLDVLAKEDEIAANGKPVLIAKLMAAVLGDRDDTAAALLMRPRLQDDPEAGLWASVLAARHKDWQKALPGFRKAMPILDRYPDGLNALLRPMVVDAALAGNDPVFAADQIGRYESLTKVKPDLALAALERGRIAAALGREEEALAEFDTAVKGDRPVEAEARLERVLYRLKEKKIPHPEAIAELETIGAIWRRGEVEVRSLAALGKLYAEAGRWREAFGAARRAVQIRPDDPLTRKLQDDMAKTFTAMFLDGKDKGLSKVEAVGLYYEFKNFTPPGRDGDEMIRHLADRLADLDLLDQATELLRHQVDHRLDGVARAQVATRLALLYLRNRKPSEAVSVLRETRLGDLPAELRRARTLLEARGLSELSLTDTAMQLLEPQSGSDVERLRADVLWRGKRWQKAGEAYELLLHDRWRDARPLDEHERTDVMRAGVAYVLGDDAIGLDRLRSKYAAKMADSADAHTFALISSEAAMKPGEFREAARAVISADTLSEFLAGYRKRYPAIEPAAMTAPATPAPAGARPAAEKPGAPPAQPMPPPVDQKPSAEAAPPAKAGKAA